LDPFLKRAHKDIARMKKVGMDVADDEEAQAHIDDMKVAEVCARQWGQARKNCFVLFHKSIRKRPWSPFCLGRDSSGLGSFKSSSSPNMWTCTADDGGWNGQCF